MSRARLAPNVADPDETIMLHAQHFAAGPAETLPEDANSDPAGTEAGAPSGRCRSAPRGEARRHPASPAKSAALADVGP